MNSFHCYTTHSTKKKEWWQVLGIIGCCDRIASTIQAFYPPLPPPRVRVRGKKLGESHRSAHWHAICRLLRAAAAMKWWRSSSPLPASAGARSLRSDSMDAVPAPPPPPQRRLHRVPLSPAANVRQRSTHRLCSCCLPLVTVLKRIAYF